MQSTVKDVMTTEIVLARKDTPFKEAARLMVAHGISALPVVDDDGRITGIASETDLLHKEEYRHYGADGYRPAPRTRLRRWLAFRGAITGKAAAVRVGEMMSTPAVTVTAETPVVLAARMMERHDVRHLPVVDGEGRVRGIVARRDLLRVFVRTDEEIAEEVRATLRARAAWVPPGYLRVSVRDGVVTLTGQLERQSECPIVVRVVRRLDGVVDVVDELTGRIDDTVPHQVAYGS